MARLRAAIDWALSDDRAAWARTVQKAKDSRGSYRLEALAAAKASLLAELDAHLERWFAPIYANAPDQERLFDTNASAEEIWALMVGLNSGIFDQKYGDVLLPFLTDVASSVPGEGPMLLSPNFDGWGVAQT
jgi:hypothetical protein